MRFCAHLPLFFSLGCSWGSRVKKSPSKIGKLKNLDCKVKLWVQTCIYQRVKRLKKSRGRAVYVVDQEQGECGIKEGGESIQRAVMADSLTFHLLSSTWFYHPSPPCIWFYLDLPLYHSPVAFQVSSLLLLIIYLGLCFSSLILTHFFTPSPPPSASYPLSISPWFTSCFQARQTVIIN